MAVRRERGHRAPMRFLDQLLLAGSLVPLGAMVLLLWTAFRAPRERPVRESQRAR